MAVKVTPQLGMQRLIYAPKAYVFVHSTTQNRIYNLSPDVVSGNVTRNINQESTAEIVLRNRYRKWLADPDNGKSILLPMDMVTIWLQRIAGKPIQVFTGYLDTVPYYQMYPGNCTLKATCTLKKLANTYFDPGTDFFTNWISHIKGWIIDPATGEASNPFQQGNVVNPNDSSQHMNDGGFGQLINDFMVQIANWRPEWVLVDGMNPDVPKIAAKLYQRINKQDESALRGLQEIMQAVTGVHIVPASAQASADGPSTVPNAIVGVVNVLSRKGADHNIPLIALVTAAQLASHVNPSYSKGYKHSRSDDWGYGVFGLKPAIHSGIEGSTIAGYSKKQIMHTDISADVFCDQLITVDFQGATAIQVQHRTGIYSSKVKKGDADALHHWLEATMKRTIPADEIKAAIGKAQSYIGAWGTDHPGQSTDEPVMTHSVRTRPELTWDSTEVQNFRGQADDMAAYKAFYAGHVRNELAPYYWMARSHFKTLRLSGTDYPSMPANMLIVRGDQREMVNFAHQLGAHTATVNGKKNLESVQYGTSIWQNGHVRVASNRSPFDSGGTGSIVIRVPTNPDVIAYPTWDGQKLTTTTAPLFPTPTTNSTAGATAQGDPTMRAEDFVAMSMASAFAVQLSFPTNYIESILLQGYKAFENDITCLEGVQQFCQASLRNFMSLPDGRFIAFYPDYFGAHGREAYWPIFDIEIVNGGVQLTDSQLATHVYVTGDVGNPDGTIDYWDRVVSRGAVTLDMPLMLRSFIQPGVLDEAENVETFGLTAGKLRTAFDFYNHFGIRVYKQDVPIIHNTYYEFLLAWQTFMLKWAETFQTTFEFTFQPEVMAGGIVAFPQHNLQMFVQSVTHTWDYGSGFQTEAELMAPAAMKYEPHRHGKQDVGGLPGFAIAGDINSVGAIGA